MDEIDKEIVAYEQRQIELESQHMGKWVLFHDLQLIGVYDSFDSAAVDAVKRFGRGPYLIRQVGAPALSLPSSVIYHPL